MSSTIPIQTVPPSRNGHRIGWTVMTVLALITATYTFYFALGATPGDPAVKRMMLSTPLGYIHVLGGGVAMAIGPFQFLHRLRRWNSRVHVWLGRLYLISVALSSMCALYLTWQSIANIYGDIGFALLATSWFWTGFKAYQTIRARDVQAHRQWMIRNFALTYAAVMLRWQFPLLFLAFGISMSTALSITGFTCWLPNLVFAEWWMRRHNAGTPKA